MISKVASCKKDVSIFYCQICDYSTSRKSSIDKHNLSSKHKMEINGNEISCTQISYQNSSDFTCECSKIFKTTSGLWKHKKICNKLKINNDQPQPEYVASDTLIEILKQNQEFKELIIEQNKMMMDMSAKINTNITNNNNTTNNTVNNKFNLNVFLNETCKDAMNLNDFVKSLQITSADFERFGKNGFVEGISNIMVKGLNKLEVCKRPIHCSDLKRDTIHLKEDNGWAKETDDGSKLKKVIKQIKHKNIDYTDAWKEENPEYKDFESKVHERYMKIINESMGGYNNEEDEVFYNKIIKNVAKETVIKK